MYCSKKLNISIYLYIYLPGVTLAMWVIIYYSLSAKMMALQWTVREGTVRTQRLISSLDKHETTQRPYIYSALRWWNTTQVLLTHQPPQGPTDKIWFQVIRAIWASWSEYNSFLLSSLQFSSFKLSCMILGHTRNWDYFDWNHAYTWLFSV